MAAQASGNIINSPQTLTEDWVDLGGELETIGYSFLNADIELNINDSTGIQFRVLILEESGGLEYQFPIQIIKSNKIEIDYIPFELSNNEDQNIIIPIDLDQRVKIIKLQVKATSLGATDGIITTAKYRQGYRQ